MAYAALVSLEQIINQILNQEPYSTSPHLISLHENVISLQAFLEDFPEKANNLEVRMRDVATAAEDIIECFMLKQIKASHEYSSRQTGHLSHVRSKLFGFVKELKSMSKKQAELAGNKFESKLKIVAEEMSIIAAEMVKTKNSIIIKDNQLSDSSIASSSSGLGNINMVGFDDDLMKIKDRLTRISPELQFLSIVGMGGIGKTTLAKNAYDDQLIQEYFDIRAWVTVSQDYRARGTFSSLLHSMKEFDPRRSEQDVEQQSIDEMGHRVYQILCGRKYVIVIDDIWSTKFLDDVRNFLPDNGNGSRILLTTRLSDVAVYADSSIHPHVMRSMDEDQSWNLFRHKVFPHENGVSPELEKIGKEITRSCKGLPLALVVVAGVVSTISKTPASWGEFAKKVNSIAAKDERLEKIVSLSYNHLPHHLRPCFLYMGAFPEDYKIHVTELIKLWIAEGFLKHPNGSKSLEEGAEEYLEDLVGRNLILVNERKFNGKIKSCSLHDMVRDTCTKLLQEENNLRQVRDLSLHNTVRDTRMRSILCFDDIKGSLQHFELLRVLHVPKFKLREEWPPWKIEKLFHLRYLAFFCYEDLPKISNFQNLQTLVFSELFLITLPSSIWKMRQLRHLIFRGSLPDPEEPTAALENLQTLKQVFNQKNSAHLHKRIPNLRKFGIFSNSKAGGANLIAHLECLHQLEKLKITFFYVGNFSDAVFPCSLKKFTLEGARNLSHLMLKAISLLPNLEVLKLWECSLEIHHSSWKIGRDEFPQLKFLMIGELVQFKALITEDDSALPRLKCLRLQHYKNLREISDDIGEISTLELIEVYGCGEAVKNWATVEFPSSYCHADNFPTHSHTIDHMQTTLAKESLATWMLEH